MNRTSELVIMNKWVTGAGNFMYVPSYSADLASKAVIVGIPFDCGVDRHRIGARFGPEAIRRESLSLDWGDEFSDVDAVRVLSLSDAGNISVISGDVRTSFPTIESALFDIASAGAVPISLGGDGAIALPEMRALKRVYPDLVAVHFDSHTDAWDWAGYDNATPFTRAAEEALIDTRRSFHIGMRGSTFTPRIARFAESLGYQLITWRQLRERGIAATIQRVVEMVGEAPVYLCFDMDFFDPAFAPGVCTPTPGGASSSDGFDIIERLEPLRLVGIDVNTVSPPHDSAGVTALLAANVVLNFINLLARNA
jgi:agmatinase